MPDQPTAETIAQMQKWFAIQCNNRAWDLASLPGRTVAEAEEMLLAAYAAAFHWSKAGGPLEAARAEVTLAHVHALRGEGDLALQFARRCLGFFEQGFGEDWDIAFAHLEMALAAVPLGNFSLYARHYDLARQCGAAIQDEQDRQVFFDEFSKIPREVLKP